MVIKTLMKACYSNPVLTVKKEHGAHCMYACAIHKSVPAIKKIREIKFRVQGYILSCLR
jgi:hypothetical protein